MRNIILVVLLILTSAVCDAAVSQTVIGWTFDSTNQLGGWVPNGHLIDADVNEDGFYAVASDWDPFISSPVFDITADPQQWIEIQMKCDRSGNGQIYWSNTMDSPYGGFLPEKMTQFVVPGGNVWRTVVIRPFWHTEKKIIHMRLDLFQDAKFTIKSIKVKCPGNISAPVNISSWIFDAGLAGWIPDPKMRIKKSTGGIIVTNADASDVIRSPLLAISTTNHSWAAIKMKASESGKAAIHWVTDGAPGSHATNFNYVGDDKFHTYNIDLGTSLDWVGNLLLLGITPADNKRNKIEIASLSLNDDISGAPDLFVDYIGMENAINRTGKPCKVMARFVNRGGETAYGIKAIVVPPRGVNIKLIELPEKFDPFIPAAFQYEFTSASPIDTQVTIRLDGKGAQDKVYMFDLKITENPMVAKSDYIPVPVPAKTDYRIGLYYFPGWDTAGKWEPISRVAPIRKPLLGWYDESDPECADWQIKWAVEHGISFFLVDWYWNNGNRTLEHWLHNAYMKSKFRKNLEWAVMWANHNPPGSHSEEDWRNVTRYWIDNYFGMSEYMRIDGKPAIFLWSPGGLRNDVGGKEGAAKLLAMSQQMAKNAGYQGIAFVSMNDGGSPALAETLAYEGYAANTEYHWFADTMSVVKDQMNFDYSQMVDRSKPAWERRAEIMDAVGMKFYPVPDTGWDARPWHGDRSMTIHNRNVEQFERLLKDAKAFVDSRREKTIVLGPCNEWGEGSYIEPNTEFGFGMYDAIRRVFCEDYPHQDIGPIDVGMGPYDLKIPTLGTNTDWDFNNSADTEGWYSLMNMSNAAVVNGALFAKVTGSDPAFSGPAIYAPASKFRYVAVRMKAEPSKDVDDVIQLFWSTSSAGVSQASMIGQKLIADGQFHTYVFHVEENPRWRGYITGFRIDPCSQMGMDIYIDRVYLSEELPKSID